MLGFEMKFRDKTLYLPLEAGCIITRRSIDNEEEMSIDVGLYDSLTNDIVNWVKEDLFLEDLIEITIKKIDKISQPLEKYDFHKHSGITKDEANKKTLNRFLILKEELKREGLI